MSSSESENEFSLDLQPDIGADDYLRAPWRVAGRREEYFQQDVDEVQEVGAEIPCQCGKCHAWPEPLMNTCCRHHDIWQTANYDKGIESLKCITDMDSFTDLLKPGPLRMMYHNYRAYHVPRYADAETLQPSIHLSEDDIKHRINAQRRMCAYRSVIFWTYPDIRRRQRKPIPSCVYLMIRSMYPNVDNEEIWADLEHTIYVDVPEED